MIDNCRPQAQALIDKWRERAAFCRVHNHVEGDAEDVYNTCADELEAILVPSPPVICRTCQGRGWIMKSEQRDFGNGLGAGGSWNALCPDCDRAAASVLRPRHEPTQKLAEAVDDTPTAST